jgi:PAS domain S-box-containing protein
MTSRLQDLKILVLEDNPGDLYLLEDYLKEKFSHLDLHHRNSYQDGEKLFKEGNQFSIILLDLILKDLNKEELVDKIQIASKNTPIIILTGYTDLELARNLLAKGVADFLLKDELSPEILYKSIVYALERENFIDGLNDSKLMYQNLFNFSPQPMWLFDNETLKFLDVNEAAINKYGYTKEEFLKLTLKNIRSEEDVIHLEHSLEKRKVDESLFAGVFKHINKAGEIMIVETYNREVEYQNKIATLVSAIDITEKVNNLEVIEKQNAQLKEIAWHQSHVVRAPLSRILGIIHLLEVESLNSKDAPFLLEQLKKSGEEMDSIIKNIVKETKSLNL